MAVSSAGRTGSLVQDPLLEGLRGLGGALAALRAQDPATALLETLELARRVARSERVTLRLADGELLALGVGDAGWRPAAGVELVSRGERAEAIGAVEGSERPVAVDAGLIVPVQGGGLLVEGARLGRDPLVVELLTVLADLAAAVAAQADARRRTDEQVEALEEARLRLREQNLLLRELAVVDELTGLYNRRYFERTMVAEMERFERNGRPVALVLFDIDHFKRVNDTWGHPAGDVVLREIAARVARTARSTDTVARFGGEEFALLMPDTDRVGARKGAERIRKAIGGPPISVDGVVLRVTASFGVAAIAPGWTGDTQALVRDADQALYRAKAAGRNRTEVSGEPDGSHREATP